MKTTNDYLPHPVFAADESRLPNPLAIPPTEACAERPRDVN
jgi:hypothetical protein